MKKIFTLLLLSACGLPVVAQTITWGTPITVTTGAGANLHPRIALNRSGNPYVLWGKTDTKAMFSKWNGTGFTTPVSPGSVVTAFAQSWAGPDMAAFGDTIYVALKRTPETSDQNHMYLVHSYDGGTTFSDTVKIDNISTNMSRFPVVTTTPNGNPQVAFMKFDAMFMNAQYAVSRSSDYGMTFSAEALASITPGEVCDCCPATIICIDTTTAVLFRNNLSNIRDMWVGLSRNSGMNFFNNRVVDTTSWMLMSCPSSGPDGFIYGDSLYSVFMSSASGASRVYMSKTAIRTATTTTSHSLMTAPFAGLTSQNYPRIANAGTKAIAVWKQTDGTGTGVAYQYTTNIMTGMPTYAYIPGTMSTGIANADVAITANAVHVVWEDDNTNTVMYIKGSTIPVGINNPTKERISVYPNPATENFTVNIDGNTIKEAFLTDDMGRKFMLPYTTQATQTTFSLHNLAKGNYYFSMTNTTGKTFYSNVIVE